MKNRVNKDNELIELNPTISIITLNVNVLGKIANKDYHIKKIKIQLCVVNKKTTLNII